MGAPKKQAQEPQPLDTLDALQTQLRDVQDQINATKAAKSGAALDSAEYRKHKTRVRDLEDEHERVQLRIAEETTRLQSEARGKLREQIAQLIPRFERRRIEAAIAPIITRLLEHVRGIHGAIKDLDSVIHDAQSAHSEAKGLLGQLPMIPSEWTWIRASGQGVSATEFRGRESHDNHTMSSWAAIVLGTVLGRVQLECPAPKLKSDLPVDPGEYVRTVEDTGYLVRLFAGARSVTPEMSRRYTREATPGGEVHADLGRRMRDALKQVLSDTMPMQVPRGLRSAPSAREALPTEPKGTDS
jgi:hypothetical protein